MSFDLNNMEDLDGVEFDDLEIADEIDINNLGSDDEDETVESNMVLDNPSDLTVGLTNEDIQDFYEYLAGTKARPMFAEKFFADGESRIRESSQLTTLMSLSFVPKLLAMQQSLINSISTPDSLKFLSVDEKLNYLQTLTNMSSKFTDTAMKYTQLSKDMSQIPLIYRQLLDQLLLIPGEKLPRLKQIPKLVDVSDEVWDRIMEIID